MLPISSSGKTTNKKTYYSGNITAIHLHHICTRQNTLKDNMLHTCVQMCRYILNEKNRVKTVFRFHFSPFTFPNAAHADEASLSSLLFPFCPFTLISHFATELQLILCNFAPKFSIINHKYSHNNNYEKDINMHFISFSYSCNGTA